jgi:hypothetical protein
LIESEYEFLKELFVNNRLDDNLKLIVRDFFLINNENEIEYKKFIDEYKLDINNIKAFDDIKDKIAYVLIEKYFENERLKNSLK